MKEKISISLSSDVLAKIHRIAGARSFRSALIERLLRRHPVERAQTTVNTRDLERINRAADQVNSEVRMYWNTSHSKSE